MTVDRLIDLQCPPISAAHMAVHDVGIAAELVGFTVAWVAAYGQKLQLSTKSTSVRVS